MVNQSAKFRPWNDVFGHKDNDLDGRVAPLSLICRKQGSYPGGGLASCLLCLQVSAFLYTQGARDWRPGP